MKTWSNYKWSLIWVLAATLFTACDQSEDPGPRQEAEEDYAILDFDRLEMGDAFIISVEESAFYSINVRGDRRNLDDLEVDKVGSTLRIRYRTYENRQHPTHITITMPALKGVNFSGASTSTVTGFTGLGDLAVILSGASVAQLGVESQVVNLSVSGASKVTLTGRAGTLEATVSGASVFSGFAFPVEHATVDVSGASKMNIMVSQTLDAIASGASHILYRGSATVNSSTSGASSVQAD